MNPVQSSSSVSGAASSPVPSSSSVSGAASSPVQSSSSVSGAAVNPVPSTSTNTLNQITPRNLGSRRFSLSEVEKTYEEVKRAQNSGMTLEDAAHRERHYRRIIDVL